MVKMPTIKCNNYSIWKTIYGVISTPSVIFTLLALLFSPNPLFAQGGRITSDPIAISGNGRPIGGAGVAVCQPLATTSATANGSLLTFVMSSNPATAGFSSGSTILVSGFTGGDTIFNAGTLSGGTIMGGEIVLAVSSTSITIASSIVHTSSTNGTILQEGNATTTCGGLSQLYTDASLTVTSNNPIYTDGLGNYGAGVAPGVYYTQTYGPGVTTTLRQIVVYCPPGASGSCGNGGGGSITGSIAAGQIAYGVAPGNVINGSSNFIYVGGKAVLQDTSCALTPVGLFTDCATGSGTSYGGFPVIHEYIQNVANPWAWTAAVATAPGNSGTIRQSFLGFAGAADGSFYFLQYLSGILYAQWLFDNSGNTSITTVNADATQTGIRATRNGGLTILVDTGFAVTIPYLSGGGTQCVQVNNSGALSGTGSGCGAGSGSVTNQVLNGVPVNTNGTSTALNSIVCTPPTTNGYFGLEYSITSNSATPPDCNEVGVIERPISGATSTDTPGASTPRDAACIPVIHDVAGSAAVTVTLPTPTTLLNPNACFIYDNHSVQTDTFKAATWTIQANGAVAVAGATGISIPPARKLIAMVDKFNASQWVVTTVDEAGSVNGILVPASASVLGTNSSSQPIAATPHQVALPLVCADTSSSATTYTCTTTPSMGALTTGDSFHFTAINQANSGASTLNIDGIGAKAIQKWQGTALAAGDLASGKAVDLVYDGTALQAMTIGNAPSGVVSPCTTSNAIGIYGTATSSTIGCGNADFTYATHTLAGGASAVVDLSAMAASTFILPNVGCGTNIGGKTTISAHSSGNGEVCINPGSGPLYLVTAGSTNTGLTCTNQVITALATSAASTCTSLTNAFLPSAISVTSVTGSAAVSGATYTTATNCIANGTAANPSVASCGSAAAGMFSCSTSASTGTCQVNTSAVTANSEIFITQDQADGGASQLNVTCNTGLDLAAAAPVLKAKVAATSFTINLGTVTANPACFEYHIVN